MAKNKKNLEETFAKAEEAQKTNTNATGTIPPSELLQQAQEKGYAQVIVIGLMPNAKLEVSSSIPNLSFIHHLLNRGAFEMNVFEMNNIASREEKPADAD